MGGIKSVAEVMLPSLIGSLVFMFFSIYYIENINWKPIIRKSLFVGATSLIPSAIGYVLYKCISSGHNMNNNVDIDGTVFVSTATEVWENLQSVISLLYSNFGYVGKVQLFSILGIRNLISVVVCTLLIFIVPVLQIKRFKEEKKEIQFFIIYGIVHNLILVLTVVLFGKTVDRYLLTTEYILIIISARYIYTYWLQQKNFMKYVWSVLFVIASLIEISSLEMFSYGWQKSLEQKKEFNQTLLNYGLSKGYASYWNAYCNEVYSDFKIQYGGVHIGEKDLKPYLFLVDSKTYDVDKQSTFLMLTEEERDIIGLNLMYIFDKPIAEYALDDMYIYVFDYDIAEDFGKVFNGDVYSYDELQETDESNAEKGKIVLSNGEVQYGPYISMKEGEYIVTWKGANLENATYDIFSNNNRDGIIYKVISISKDEVKLKLKLLDDIEGIEFRAYNDSLDTVEIYGIIVE